MNLQIVGVVSSLGFRPALISLQMCITMCACGAGCFVMFILATIAVLLGPHSISKVSCRAAHDLYCFTRDHLGLFNDSLPEDYFQGRRKVQNA